MNTNISPFGTPVAASNAPRHSGTLPTVISDVTNELAGIKAQLSALAARVQSSSDSNVNELDVRLRQLEDMQGFKDGFAKDVAKAINDLKRDVASLAKRQAAANEPSVIPGVTEREFKLLDLITSATATEMKRSDSKLDDVTAGFKSLAAEVRSSQALMEQLAMASCETAAAKLQRTAREFVQYGHAKTFGSPSPQGVIEASILSQGA